MQLPCFDCRQVVGAAQEQQGGKLVELVDQRDRHTNQQQYDHMQSNVPVDWLEQLVQGQEQEYEDRLADEPGGNAATKQPFGSHDVACCCCGISVYNESIAHVQAEDGEWEHEEIQEPCDSCGPVGRLRRLFASHGSSSASGHQQPRV
jgi:hypothetical protein